MAKKKAKRKTKKASTRKRTTRKSSAKSAAKPEPKKQAKKTIEPWRRVNRIQLALLMDVHPDTVSDYSRSGMPVITRGGAGKESAYDAVECLDWHRAQQGHKAKEAAQTRAYEAQAKLNELKIAQQKGELVPKDQVILAGQSYTKAWTAKVRAIPRQLVQSGVIPRDRENDVTKLMHALLTEISEWKTLPKEEEESA